MKFSYVSVISIKPPQLLFCRNERNPFQLKEIEKTDEIASGAILIIFFDQPQGTVFSVIGVSGIHGREETKKNCPL